MKTLTVADLISCLQVFPTDYVVKIDGCDCEDFAVGVVGDTVDSKTVLIYRDNGNYTNDHPNTK
ncbi:MAG: hypothetical protein Q8P23_00950 [bacterium]|nr:hypothetical protein [bacterium]